MPPEKSKGKAGGQRDPEGPGTPDAPTNITITGPDGKQYQVNTKTGVVRDMAGNIVAGATYESSTGNFHLPGFDPIDTLPEIGAPLLGSTYQRDFTGGNFNSVIDPADGTVYFVHKKTGRVFTQGGTHVGMFLNGQLDIQWTPKAEEPPEEEPPPGEEPGPPGLTTEQESILDLLKGFLTDNDLPESLLDWIKSALQEGKGQQQILAELYQTPEFLAAYPEVGLREQAGLSWLPPAVIRQQRDEIKRISGQLLGFQPTAAQIAGLIGGGVSLSEWESRIDTYKRFEKYGPLAKELLSVELEREITDDELFDFMAFDVSTPDLDKAYENSLYRFFRSQAGLGIGPRAETELLRQFGVDVDQAFKGYQGIVAEMPRAQRLDAIERQIQGTASLPDTGNDVFNDTPYATLFRAIQLNDADALRKLRAQMARDTARFQSGGAGVATDQQGRAAGLLTPGERR